MIEIDKREIYRYLGYHGQAPQKNVLREVDSCLEELREAVTPRYVYRQYPVERLSPDDRSGSGSGSESKSKSESNQGSKPGPGTGSNLLSNTEPEPGSAPDPESLTIAGMVIKSSNLSRNLRDCETAYLMAATLGIGPDRLIARASVSRMSRAVILQAAAAAMIEAWCDEVNQMIIGEAAEQGLYCRPRFSPGYGDFSLEYQKDFAQILRIQKEIGVSLTESLLMMPSKSVTAVIGLSPVKKECVLHGCEVCTKAGNCSFSRVEATGQQPPDLDMEMEKRSG